MLLMQESVLSVEEEKNPPTFKFPTRTEHLLRLTPLNIIFDDFSI